MAESIMSGDDAARNVVTPAPVTPLPSTPMYKNLDREEIAVITRGLGANSPHPLIYSIVNTFGVGKTTALRQIEAAARRKNVSVVWVDVPKLLEKYGDSINRQIYLGVLRKISQKLGLPVEPDEPAQVGSATLVVKAKETAEAINKAKKRLVLLFDDAAESEQIVAVMQRLESMFFSRLADGNASSNNVTIVVASQQRIPWLSSSSAIQQITLSPFSRKQTQLQFENEANYQGNLAEKLWQTTGGLPAANARLWQLFSDSKDERYLSDFARVEAEFINPLIKDAEWSPLIYPVALLYQALSTENNAGNPFLINQLITAATTATYHGNERYLKMNSFDYYAELDGLSSAGIVTYDPQQRGYCMEPHVAQLVYKVTSDGDEQVTQLREQLTAPKPTESETVEPPIAELDTPQPAKDYDELYQRILEEIKKEAQSDHYFVGRGKVMEEVAAYLCRQPGFDANFIFITAKPGSGKTALLRKMLKVIRNAAEGFEQLIVPGQSTKSDGQQTNSQQAEDYSDIIELDISATARLTTVRRKIRKILGDALKEEAAIAFKEFDKLDKQAQTERSIDNPIDNSDTVIKLRKENEDRERAFSNGLTNISRLKDIFKSENVVARRILLVFDTLDYPIRSSLSSFILFGEIMRSLGGQLFCIIAGRPLIKEEENPPIEGEIGNYLPDNLVRSAKHIDLDKADDNIYKYDLKPEEIKNFYQGRRWYEVAKRANSEAADKLVDQISRIVADKRIPVLLNLLEYYADIDGYDDSMLPGTLKAITDISEDIEKLSKYEEREFERALIEGFLTKKGRSGKSAPWAMMLLSMADRGLSQTMVAPIMEQIREIIPEELVPLTTSDIWKAVEQIAFTDAISSRSTEEINRIGLRDGSTLVKLVSEPDGQRAYKLHDYVSQLFDRFFDVMHESGTAKDWHIGPLRYFKVPPYIIREQVTLEIIDYLNKKAHEFDAAANQTAKKSDKRKLRWIYHELRANQIYYSLRFAALQHQAVKQRYVTAAKITTGPLHQTPEKPSFNSDQLQTQLRKSKDARTSVQLTLWYVWAKMLRSITNFAEFGFGEVLINEVSFFKTNQNIYPGEREEKRVQSLVIPFEIDNTYHRSRELYYAALTFWQIASGSYVNDKPWANGNWPAVFSALRDGTDAEELPSDYDEQTRKRDQDLLNRARGLLQGPMLKDFEPLPVEMKLHLNNQAEARIQLDYWFMNWLEDKNYYGWADRLSYRLLEEREVLHREEIADLQFKRASFVTKNPQIAGAGLGMKAGLQRAEEILKQVQTRNMYKLARKHNELGYIYRIMGRFRWGKEENSQISEEYSWGAAQHYIKALEILNSADAKNQTDEHRMQYAIALTGLSYVLAFMGFTDLHPIAHAVCKQGIEILEHLDRSNERVAARLGRAYSTQGEISRLEARSYTDQYSSAEKTSYEEAIESYTKSDGITIDPEWEMILIQQATFTRFRLAELEKRDDEYARFMLILEIASDSVDEPHALDALRRLCVVLWAMAKTEKDKGDEGKANHYYDKAESYYYTGLELSNRLNDAYNFTRLVLEATEGAAEIRNMATAKDLFLKAMPDDLSPSWYKGNPFERMLIGFAKVIFALAQIKNEARISDSSLKELEAGFSSLPVELIEEQLRLRRILKEIGDYVKAGRFDQENHLDRLYVAVDSIKTDDTIRQMMLNLIRTRRIDRARGAEGMSDGQR